MKIRFRTSFTALTIATIVLATSASAQQAREQGARGGPPRGGGPETKTASVTQSTDAAIQWYATLERGLAEAKRTGKPIIFVTGAPHCAGVSGMWCPGKKKIDDGWLFQKEIIDASQNFVCIRLTSYESKSEAAFIENLRGNPVNTAFAILDPSGKPALEVKGLGRGPGELFEDPADMAKQLNEIAAKYPQKISKANSQQSSQQGSQKATSKETAISPALPVTLSVKLGLAVASADLQPLVLVVASDPALRATLEAKVAKLAWSKDFQGFFTYANAASTNGLLISQTGEAKDGVFIIEPDIFGATGKVVARVSATEVDKNLASAMKDALSKHVRMSKSRNELKRLALANGIFFETGIPVSGTREAADREKYKQQLDEQKKSAAASKSSAK